jgi:CheY-like chemotaxis protein
VPKILVADDNANIQKMVALALEERGIHVVSVGNGEAAVRRIPDLDPDLVLADIFMPVRNGYEVCEFVKKDERFSHVPVILLVGAFDPLDEKEARRVGADGVLKKPFVPPDPLIAMVTAALEKNPKLAAELAKAKEAKMAPEPEPVAALEAPARAEPKPLPEFPEPTPEEAALVYGFGKGHREIGEDGKVGADEPPAPVAEPRDESGEEEFDDSSTATDWRRSAMELDIPADVASKPAFSSTEDLDPISFPSEKDYPPRRVPVSEIPAQIQPPVPSPTPGDSQISALAKLEDTKAEHAQDIRAVPVELPEAPESQFAPAPEAHESEVQEPSAPEAESQAQNLHEVNSTSIGSHWLDTVESTQPEYPAGGWMSALTRHQEKLEAAPEAAPENEAASQATSEPEMAGQSAPEASSFDAPVSAWQPQEKTSSAEPQDAPPLSFPDHAEAHQGHPFFADEVAAEGSSAPPAHEDFAGSFPSTAAPVDRDIEPEPEDSEPSLAFKDPALVEPPAVHVTPEPLLVNEEPHGPSRYGMTTEETSPLHSFLVPAPADSAAAPEQSAAVEAGADAPFNVKSIDEPPPEAAPEEMNERIPTMAPPNREALADIPFLMPPPSIDSEDLHHDSRQADQDTVDTVVQRVLERLEPQLHELLSQGLLKPLVENLLHDEMAKKSK